MHQICKDVEGCDVLYQKEFAFLCISLFNLVVLWLLCLCVLMMMMICYLERSLVVFICESITMMNNHHTVEIMWSLGWSTDNVMIVQFCAWYCYWATSDSHSVGELTQSFLGFFLWLMFFYPCGLENNLSVTSALIHE